MNKISRFLVILGVFLGAQRALPQPMGYLQPRLIVGGDAALFRISLDEFTSIYQHRVGPSYAAMAGIRAFGGHYILFKYSSFQQDGKQGTDPRSGLDLQKAHWDEKWYSVGLRMHPPLSNRTQSYYGFGLAFFDVTEEPNLSVFSASDQQEGLGTGFYLETGLEYFVFERAAMFFELEISSGGTKGKTGFEAFSIGGFRFAMGLTFWPF